MYNVQKICCKSNAKVIIKTEIWVTILFQSNSESYVFKILVCILTTFVLNCFKIFFLFNFGNYSVALNENGKQVFIFAHFGDVCMYVTLWSRSKTM